MIYLIFANERDAQVWARLNALAGGEYRIITRGRQLLGVRVTEEDRFIVQESVFDSPHYDEIEHELQTLHRLYGPFDKEIVTL